MDAGILRCIRPAVAVEGAIVVIVASLGAPSLGMWRRGGFLAALVLIGVVFSLCTRRQFVLMIDPLQSRLWSTYRASLSALNERHRIE